MSHEHRALSTSYTEYKKSCNSPGIYKHIADTRDRDYFYNYSGYLSNPSAGQQSFHNLEQTYTGSNLAIIANKVISSDPSPIINQEEEFEKFVIKGVKGEVMLTNQTNTPVIATLYEVYPHHDMSTSATPFSGENVTAMDPVTTIYGGAKDLTGASAASNLVYGFTPYMSAAFTENWHVYKRTMIPMSPGQTHIHKYSYKIPFVWENQTYSLPQRIQWYRKRSMALVLQIYGTPIASGTDASSTTSKAVVAYVGRSRYLYNYTVNEKPFIDYANNISTTVDTTPVMNSLTGAASAYQQA